MSSGQNACSARSRVGDEGDGQPGPAGVVDFEAAGEQAVAAAMLVAAHAPG